MNNTILIYKKDGETIVKPNIPLFEAQKIIAEKHLVDYSISTAIDQRGSFSILTGQEMVIPAQAKTLAKVVSERQKLENKYLESFLEAVVKNNKNFDPTDYEIVTEYKENKIDKVVYLRRRDGK